MKKLLLILGLAFTPFAHGGCSLTGQIRLAPPYNALICKVDGRTKWIVGYSQPSNAFLVTDAFNGNAWLLPVKPQKRYQSSTVTEGSGSAIILKTEAFEDDQRMPVTLDGN